MGLIFLWKSVLIFENFSRFSREPLGLPLSDFWEPGGVCRVLRTPGHLDLVRPASSNAVSEVARSIPREKLEVRAVFAI